MNTRQVLSHLLGPAPCWAQLIAHDHSGKRVLRPTRIDTEEQARWLIEAHLHGDPWDWAWMREDGSGGILEDVHALGMHHLRHRPQGIVCAAVSLDIDGGNHDGGTDDGAESAMREAIGLLLRHDEAMKRAIVAAPSMSGRGRHVHLLLADEAPSGFAVWLARLLAEETSARSGYALTKIEARPLAANARLGTAMALPWAGGLTHISRFEPASIGSMTSLLELWRAWHERVEERKANQRMAARTMLERTNHGDRFERCERYLSAMPVAVQGQQGHRATVRACMAGGDFGLDEHEFWPLLCAWNARCQPPWKEPQLKQQMIAALRSRRSPHGCKLAQR